MIFYLQMKLWNSHYNLPILYCYFIYPYQHKFIYHIIFIKNFINILVWHHSWIFLNLLLMLWYQTFFFMINLLNYKNFVSRDGVSLLMLSSMLKYYKVYWLLNNFVWTQLGRNLLLKVTKEKKNIAAIKVNKYKMSKF